MYGGETGRGEGVGGGVRWGNGGVPGICGKTWGDGVVASVLVLLGVERLVSPVRAPLLQHLTSSLLSST